MANGKVHNKDAAIIGSLAVPAITIGMLLSEYTLFQIIISAIFSFVSLFLIYPDVDQPTTNKAQYRLNVLIPVLGYANIWLWHNYAQIFKHRSFFSHFPIISTLIRLLYIWCWINVAIFCAEIFQVRLTIMNTTFDTLDTWYPSVLTLIYTIPLFINDTFHWLRDDMEHIPLRNSLDIW